MRRFFLVLFILACVGGIIAIVVGLATGSLTGETLEAPMREAAGVERVSPSPTAEAEPQLAEVVSATPVPTFVPTQNTQYQYWGVGTDEFPAVPAQDAGLIAQVQGRLGLTPTGNFGAETAEAVKAFQVANGLTADGIVGPNTAARLGITWPSGSTVRYAPNLREIAESGGTGWLIYASNRSNRLIVYQRQDGHWAAVQDVQCATGTRDAESRTPDGVFRITGNYSDSISYGGKESRDATWLDNGHAIASIRYDGTTYSTNLLGRNIAGDGNILVNPDLASWIRWNVPVGTPVVIDDRKL